MKCVASDDRQSDQPASADRLTAQDLRLMLADPLPETDLPVEWLLDRCRRSAPAFGPDAAAT